MDEAEIRRIAGAAAEDAANRVLARMGFHDENAADDIRDLRGLLDAWRDAKATARRTVVAWVVKGALLALAGAVGWTILAGRH